MVKIQDASASSGPETDDPDAASIEAAMRVPVTVTLGPMGTLLRKLHSLMAPGQSLAPDLLGAEEVCLLSDGLTKLCISLKNMSEDEDPSFMVQWWMKIVRELCYDTEDHLDEVCRAGTHHDFSDLLARAEDASESRQCFEWSPPKTIKPAEQGGAGVSRRTSPELQVPLPVHVEPPNKLVELLGLHSDGKTLKVIPITGCAGVGKTTAARALYHRHGGKFQCQAFVTVSRNPDMRGFLTSILSQLKAPRPHGFPDVPDLIDAIHKHLQGKRYFIVVDDLWTSSVWNIISRAFPCGDYCSRIITTTQIDDVALACCSYDPVYMYKMFPLNDPESRKLFFGIMFGSEDGCPIDIKEVSYDIVKKCSGLPLAVVNIARLLASESNIVRERWEHIQDSLPSTSEEMMDVLNLLYNILPHLMYNSLPPRLRTCLLYLSMYSEGHVIKKDELVKLWVAEGFLSAVGGRNTQEIAEGYFDELVGRGMVQAVDINNNGEVLSCTVHQMVLDFIRLTSVEENFVINVDCFQSTLALPDKVHRLSVQFGGVKGAYIPESIITSQVRSLIFWGFFKCVPSIMDCRLLRILILRIWDDEDNESFDLTGIGELFLLKYLEIDCNITVKLPEKDNIPWLQHLETLHVDARLSAVPSDIINMKRLLQLRLPSEYILPSIVAKMTSLRTLGYFDVSSYTVGDVLHLGELTNLQDLQLTCSTVQPAENLERNMQLLGWILEKLTVLQSLTLVPAASDSSCVNIPKDGFNMACPPPDLLLQRIELSRRCCIFFSLPNWFGELMKLRILKIAISKLSMNDADMLKGLPALTALTLYIQTVSEERIVIDKGGFRVLTYFKFMCNAPWLSFVQGAMPKVQKLKLGFSSNEWRSHTFETVGICHLTGLTEVSLKFRARAADEFDIKAAESKLEAAVSNHPNTLVIRVHCVDVIFYAEEDKSTATEGIEEQRQEIQEGKKKITECSEEREENRQEINVDEKRLSEIWEVRDENISWEQHVNMQVESRYARTDRVSTPLKHHTQSVNVVTGAMGSLLPKLLELLKDEYNQEAKVKDSVESLHKELEGMQDDLRIVAKLKQKELDDVTRIWAKQVRDLSYDAEDVIDSLPLCVEGSRGGTHRHITGVTELLARQEIADVIDGIMKQAQDLAARRDSENKIGLHIAANPNAAANIDHPLLALYKDPKDMVGIEVPRDEVIMKLTDGAGDVFKQLRIISIVGMGGLGKTTLAKAVYDKIKVQYDCTAFVLVSRDPDMRKVYMDILLEIGKQKYMDRNLAKMDERQLIDEITGLLANKRYFIVCDDIWDANSWEVIKLALIDNGLGSRVVTTTRILEVAINASDVYRLKALSDSHSEELFNTRLFGGKDNVPHDVPRVPEKLLQKCGGVPLAIIRMASLLVGKPTDDFYNNIDFWPRGEGNADVDNARKILLSSYYDLPYHLRACLLHLHIFPDDCLIKKETLIWKWAAEGLIVEEPLTGRGLFEIGEGYLKELINRNVVVSVEDDSCPGKVTGCRVHDLVFEMICYLSTEENFVTALDGSEQYPRVESKARRIAVQKWAAEQADPLANIRPESLRSFNTTGCHFRMELSLARFELLRVIAIEECSLFKDNHFSSSLRNKGNCSRLKHLGKLHLLRYLGLYNTRIGELPEEIGDLIYLQTLDLRGTGISEKLPWTVSQLRQLKCLRIDRYIAVPDWMGRLTSLEELRLGYVRGSKNFLKELGRLTELRELEIWIDELDENQNKDLVESMRKLEKIQVLRVRGSHWSSSAAALNWGELHPYGQMHELRLNIASRLPTWINISRVPMLSYLSLHVKAVEQKDLDILGALPELITLDLVMWSNAFLSIKGFPKLRRIHTSSTFMFLLGAMPRLESLHFEIDVPALKYAKVNFDHDLVASTLGNLLSLEKLEVRIRSTVDYFEAMRKSVERAVDKHPNRPSLHVRHQNISGGR